MNNELAQLVLLSHQIKRQHLELMFAVVALAMPVAGVGAPSDGGGAGRRSSMGMLHHHSP